MSKTEVGTGEYWLDEAPFESMALFFEQRGVRRGEGSVGESTKEDAFVGMGSGAAATAVGAVRRRQCWKGRRFECDERWRCTVLKKCAGEDSVWREWGRRFHVVLPRKIVLTLLAATVVWHDLAYSSRSNGGC